MTPVAVLGFGYDLGVDYGFDYNEERYPQWYRDGQDHDTRQPKDFAYDILLAACEYDATLPDGDARDAAIDAMGVKILEHGGSDEPRYLICVHGHVTDIDTPASLASIGVKRHAIDRLDAAFDLLSLPVPQVAPQWILAAHGYY